MDVLLSLWAAQMAISVHVFLTEHLQVLPATGENTHFASFLLSLPLSMAYGSYDLVMLFSLRIFTAFHFNTGSSAINTVLVSCWVQYLPEILTTTSYWYPERWLMRFLITTILLYGRKQIRPARGLTLNPEFHQYTHDYLVRNKFSLHKYNAFKLLWDHYLEPVLIEPTLSSTAYHNP